MVKISVVAEFLVFWNPAASTGDVVEFEQSRLEVGTFEKFAEIFRWGVWSVWVLVVNPHEEIVFAEFFQEFYGPVGSVLCDSFGDIPVEFMALHFGIIFVKALLPASFLAQNIVAYHGCSFVSMVL